MKTPWRIQDWNRIKITCLFAAICWAVVMVVVAFRIDAWVHRPARSVSEFYLHDRKTPVEWIAETKEPTDYVPYDRLALKFIELNDRYEGLVESLKLQNAALKKRIDELEAFGLVGKATNDTVWGQIYLTNSLLNEWTGELQRRSVPHHQLDSTLGRMFLRSTNNMTITLFDAGTTNPPSVTQALEGSWRVSDITNYLVTQDDLRRAIESVYPPPPLAQALQGQHETVWEYGGFFLP